MISLIISSTTDPRCLKPLSTILVDLLLNETYYVENIKSTNLNLGTNTKSTNLRIHELVIFNQTTKIDTHEEKYFHSILHDTYSFNSQDPGLGLTGTDTKMW